MDKRERRDSLRREFHSFKQEGYQQGTYRVISEKGNEGNRGGIGGQAKVQREDKRVSRKR